MLVGAGACRGRVPGIILLVLLGFLASGCTALQPGVPAAIVYDRDRDAWRVEVAPIIGEDEPEYPNAVPIFTEEGGERREGLIPPVKYRVRDKHVGVVRWRGPLSLWCDEGVWRIQLSSMILPRSPDPDAPIGAGVNIHTGDTDPIPRYIIHVEDAGFRW